MKINDVVCVIYWIKIVVTENKSSETVPGWSHGDSGEVLMGKDLNRGKTQWVFLKLISSKTENVASLKV